MEYSPEFLTRFRANYGPRYAPKKPEYVRCCAYVYSGLSNGQCSRKNGHGPDSAYCKQHDPDARQAKADLEEKARAAKYERGMRLNSAAGAIMPALIAIAEGHEDPRGLAVRVVAEYNAAKEATP